MDDIFGEDIAYWVISGFLILLGIFGVVLAANAVDQAMMIFGLVLAAFSVFFCYFSIDRAFSLAAREKE